MNEIKPSPNPRAARRAELRARLDAFIARRDRAELLEYLREQARQQDDEAALSGIFGRVL